MYVCMHICIYTKLLKYISSCIDNFESLKKVICYIVLILYIYKHLKKDDGYICNIAFQYIKSYHGIHHRLEKNPEVWDFGYIIFSAFKNNKYNNLPD